MRKKRVLVDMSATILHHGHIRLLKKASRYGNVIVGLSSDKDIKKFKGYKPELNFTQRKEILMAITYVFDVVKINHVVTERDIKKNRIDLLIHGDDYNNHLKKTKYKILKRTPKVSTNLIRKKSSFIYKKISKKN